MLSSVDVQLQDVARALLLVMRNHLNAAIDDVWDEENAKDADFYPAIGEAVPTVPKQYPSRYFLGHHPSILERPAADYPNVTVVAHRHRSAADVGADQCETVANTAYVEAFLLNADEEVLNNAVNRYAKAVNRVLTAMKSLEDPDVMPIDSTPQIDVSNAAARRLEEFKEDIVYVQGCRIEHVFNTIGLW